MHKRTFPWNVHGHTTGYLNANAMKYFIYESTAFESVMCGGTDATLSSTDTPSTTHS